MSFNKSSNSIDKLFTITPRKCQPVIEGLRSPKKKDNKCSSPVLKVKFITGHSKCLNSLPTEISKMNIFLKNCTTTAHGVSFMFDREAKNASQGHNKGRPFTEKRDAYCRGNKAWMEEGRLTVAVITHNV